MIATSLTVGQAEKIIDNACLVLFPYSNVVFIIQADWF